MANNSISLVLLALSGQHQDVFHMTLVSNDTYEAALQEVIGIGRVILKNEREVVRVEIHKDVVMPASPLVVLSRDDISFEEREPKKRQVGIVSLLHWLCASCLSWRGKNS